MRIKNLIVICCLVTKQRNVKNNLTVSSSPQPLKFDKYQPSIKQVSRVANTKNNRLATLIKVNLSFRVKYMT